MIRQYRRPFSGTVMELWRVHGTESLKASVLYEYISQPYLMGTSVTDIAVPQLMAIAARIRKGNNSAAETISVALERMAVKVENVNLEIWMPVSSFILAPVSGGSAWGNWAIGWLKTFPNVSGVLMSTPGYHRLKISATFVQDREMEIVASLWGASSRPEPIGSALIEVT